MKKTFVFFKKDVTFFEICYKIKRSEKILVWETLLKRIAEIIITIFGEKVNKDDVEELQRLFEEQVANLPPTLHRTIVFGIDGECKNYAELAEALSIVERKEVTEDAVKKRVERGLNLLEEYLKNEYR